MSLPALRRGEADFLVPHDWTPRGYQKAAWNYWVRDGGRHMELVWHRRSGKDEIALHGTAVHGLKRTANYWHMLPLATQVRKAIWEAVNPRTGKRRIDEAFPHEIREATRESEMFIKLVNGSTWQCLGSDNFQGAIGSNPAGIVYSEWAQSNPSSRGFLRPILAENNGWQVYITTPRGKNHAYRTLKAAQKERGAFAQVLTADDTDVFTPETLEAERLEYVSTYGEDMGQALFEQEYYCSFDAAIVGSYWGAELRKAQQEGRVCRVPHDPEWPVFTAWDIGYDDDAAIWWYQVVGGEIHVLECYSNSGKDPDHYASQLLGHEVQIDLIGNQIVVTHGKTIPELQHREAYDYGMLWLPHDAKAKTFAAKGKSVQEQLSAVFGWGRVGIVPNLSIEDGIQAARKTIPRCVFDVAVEDDIETLKQYQREWDDDRKMFKDRPLHDWTSHVADAFRYLSVAWQERKPIEKPEEPRFPVERTFNELVAAVGRRRGYEE